MASHCVREMGRRRSHQDMIATTGISTREDHPRITGAASCLSTRNLGEVHRRGTTATKRKARKIFGRSPASPDDLVLDAGEPEVARVGAALAREHERAEEPLYHLRQQHHQRGAVLVGRRRRRILRIRAGVGLAGALRRNVSLRDANTAKT